MKSLSFRKDLIGIQEELLRFAYKLTANREEANDLLQETSLKALDNEDKYIPDTNFKGWMYTIMRNIFINNYRKIVRDQTYVDQTDNLYHLNLPQDSGFESTEGAYDLTKKFPFSIPFDIVRAFKKLSSDSIPPNLSFKYYFINSSPFSSLYQWFSWLVKII